MTRSGKAFGQPKTNAVRSSDVPSSINLRSIIVTLIFLIPLIVLIEYAEFTGFLPSIPTIIAPSVAGIFILLLLLVFNRFASHLGRTSWVLDTKELVTVYVFISLGGFLAALGLVGVGLGVIAGLYVRALEVPDTYMSILDKLPSWAIIKDDVAGLEFWMGGSSTVPWEAWIKPLVFWSILWTAIFFVIICMFTLVRKHWNDQERLVYPLTLPVLEMVGQPQGDIQLDEPIWRNRIFLFGLIWPVFNGIMGILHGLFPGVPTVPYVLVLSEYFVDPPFNVIGEWKPLEFVFNAPTVTGIGYLVSTEITFSIWFFHIMNHVSRIILYIFNGSILIGKARVDWEVGRGVMFGVAFTSLWFARRNIWDVVKRALGNKDNQGIDEDEPLSYPVAFWGGLVALTIVFVSATSVLRIDCWTFAVYFAIFLGISLAFMRLRAESGYPVNMGNVSYLYEGVLNRLPESWLDKTTAASLGVHFNVLSSGGAFSGVPGLVAESYKFAEAARIKSRSMTKWLVTCLVFTFVLGSVVALPIVYKYGLLNMDFYRSYHSRLTWAHVPIQQLNGRNPVVQNVAFFVGVIVAVVFQLARTSFAWWPFNTIAMGIATDQWVVQAWGPFFISWIVKSAIMRYGGYSMVKKLRPFFIALILGGAGMSGLQSFIFIVYNLLR